MYAHAGGRRRARLGGDEYTFPGTPASFPGLGLSNGDVDPQTGLIWDDAQGTWRRADGTDPAYEAAIASYPENPFANMTELQKAQYIAGAYGANAAAKLSAVYQPVGGVYDPAAAQAAAQQFISGNSSAISNVVTAVQTAQAASIANASAINDYVARSGGDLDTWYRLYSGGAERYTMASNGGALLDNALLAYTSLKSGGADVSALAASAATADADRAEAFQHSLSTGGFTAGMVSPQTAQAAVQAIEQAGGDPRQWTSVVDTNTGDTIGLVKRAPDGSITMAPPGGATLDLQSAAQTVTGFIDRAAGTIQNIGTTVARVGQAIKGAEVGATAGWNAPANLNKYFLVGGVLLVATMIFAPSGRKRK